MVELLLAVLGQATEGNGAGPGSGAPGGIGQYLSNPIVMMILMFGVIYFMLIRPQSKKRKEHESWVSNLKRGDGVVTQGGVVGRITGVADKVVTLEVARDVRMRVLRSHISGSDSTVKGEARPESKGKGKGR